MQLAAISTDPPEESLQLAQEYGIDFPLLSDPQREAIRAFRVADDSRDIAVPAVFLVNEQRQILWSQIGEFIANRPSPKKLLKIFAAHNQ